MRCILTWYGIATENLWQIKNKGNCHAVWQNRKLPQKHCWHCRWINGNALLHITTALRKTQKRGESGSRKNDSQLVSHFTVRDTVTFFSEMEDTSLRQKRRIWWTERCQVTVFFILQRLLLWKEDNHITTHLLAGCASYSVTSLQHNAYQRDISPFSPAGVCGPSALLQLFVTSGYWWHCTCLPSLNKGWSML